MQNIVIKVHIGPLLKLIIGLLGLLMSLQASKHQSVCQIESVRGGSCDITHGNPCSPMDASKDLPLMPKNPPAHDRPGILLHHLA